MAYMNPTRVLLTSIPIATGNQTFLSRLLGVAKFITTAMAMYATTHQTSQSEDDLINPNAMFARASTITAHPASIKLEITAITRAI